MGYEGRKARCRRDIFLQVWIVMERKPDMILSLLSTIASNVSIPVIASGGAGSNRTFS